jgi:hypothetical protein
MDISVILPFNNNFTDKQLSKCIDYCKQRNVTVEVVSEEKQASSNCIHNFIPNMFYFEYTLYIQWRALAVLNKQCNYYSFTKTLVYDNEKFCITKHPSVVDMFSMRKVGYDKQKVYVENDIFPGVYITNVPSDDVDSNSLLPTEADLVKIICEIVENDGRCKTEA